MTTMHLTTRAKIALASVVQKPIVASLALCGRGPVTNASRGGIRWELDLAEGIDFSIWLLGAFEPVTVRAYSRYVRPGMAVLDIGANVGAHTLPLARLVGPDGHVIAFEPTDWAMGKLKKNISLNPALASRITCRQTMLAADEDAVAPEALPASWPLAGGDDVHPKLRGRAMSARAANVTTLDHAVRDLGLRQLGFIKLDVDGHECMILRGGHDTLRRFRPIIITELSPYILAERGSSVIELVEILTAAGYSMFHLADEKPLLGTAKDIATMIPDGGSINVLCRPRAGA